MHGMTSIKATSPRGGAVAVSPACAESDSWSVRETWTPCADLAPAAHQNLSSTNFPFLTVTASPPAIDLIRSDATQSPACSHALVAGLIPGAQLSAGGGDGGLGGWAIRARRPCLSIVAPAPMAGSLPNNRAAG
jgi:hypothetical protein